MYISIEGLIGSGKSQLLDYLQDNVIPSGCSVVHEDVELWKSFHGTNLLHECYNHNAFPLQCIAPASRLLKYGDLLGRNFVSERSVFTDVVFQRVYQRKNDMSELEGHINTTLLQAFEKKARIPDLFVYLKVNTNECLRRCKQRAREEESVIDLEFLELLEDEYEKRMNELKSIATVIEIDGTQSTQDIATQIFGEIKRDCLFFKCPLCEYESFHKSNFKKHLYTKSHLSKYLLTQLDSTRRSELLTQQSCRPLLHQFHS